MGALLKHLWNDEQFFLRWCSAALFVFGAMVASGKVPTFVNGLGPELGPWVQALAVAIATGKLKLPRVSETTVTATAITVAPAEPVVRDA